MVRVVYSKNKGLISEAGDGFQINDVSLLEEIQAIASGSPSAVKPYGVTTLNVAGVEALTLAAPTAEQPAGVQKVITCIARSGGTATVTLTGGGIQTDGASALATIAFDAANETAVLVSNGTKWICILAAGATQA